MKHYIEFSNNYKQVIVVLVTVSVLFAQCKQTQNDAPLNSQPSQAGTNDSVIFFDDFNTSHLDTTKWNAEVTGIHVNNELQAYVDSAATIQFTAGDMEGAKNGALILQPNFSPAYKTADGQSFDFVSGRINTKGKFDFLYGKAEARIKLSAGAGLWPAWWMLGNATWPETGEVDIMENIGEPDWANAAIHGPGYSGDAGLVNRLYFADSNNVTSWHTYAVSWGPDSMVFSYDDVPMFRITKPMTDFFGKWVFDNNKYLILNFAVGGIYPYKINGIKKPYYGLSEPTFQSIKNKKSKMVVDWVRVTKTRYVQ